MDMRQICGNCPKKDSCKMQQKYRSPFPDYYYTIDGRKVDIVKICTEKYAKNPVAATPDWEQLSFL